MEHNYAAEIEALKEQIAQLQAGMQQIMTALAPQLTQHTSEGDHPMVGHVEKMAGMHPLPEVNTILDRLENACGADGSTGRITYMGVFASGGRQSTWVKNDLNTDSLLSLIEKGTAEKVLACVGSNDRLNMLLAILRKPRTVAELVSDCGFSSGGQVYHHLKPLLAADLVTQDKRGSYIIQPHRVQGVIMLLAGIADLVDGTYTQGTVE